LCASLYAQSDVTARVAGGREVTVTETTDYPFADTIVFKVATPSPVQFPLYLRVPQWATGATVQVNGKAAEAEAKPPSYLLIDREWKDGDTLTLKLPMRTTLRTWARNKNAVSVDRGPLTYSLRIGEQYKPYGTNQAWPEYEVFATTPWNYALVLDGQDPAASLEVVARPGPLPENPFKDPPVTIKARAQRLPNWTLDANGLLHTLQPSPTKSSEPVEAVELIPMGAARLRITAFPVIGTGPDAKEWVRPPEPPRASHCFAGDTTLALNDGVLPKSSADRSIPRMTWWNHKGTTEWVEYDFDKPRRLTKASVYWYDDEPTGGGCRTPASWRLLYQSGDAWREVQNPTAHGADKDRFNDTAFGEIETTAVRLEVKLKPGFSGGILEWRVE
jgi:hypothetical protein